MNYFKEYFSLKNNNFSLDIPKRTKYFLSGFFLEDLFGRVYEAMSVRPIVNDLIPVIASMDFYVCFYESCERFNYEELLEYYNELNPENKIRFNIYLMERGVETGVVEDYDISKDKTLFDRKVRKTAKPEDNDVYKLLRAKPAETKVSFISGEFSVKEYFSPNNDDPDNIRDITVFVCSKSRDPLIPLGMSESNEYICIDVKSGGVILFNANTLNSEWIAPNIYAFVKNLV